MFYVKINKNVMLEYELVDNSWEDLKIKIDSLKKKAIYFLTYKNILINRNNNDVWIIDFDKCKIDYCAHDISYFLRRLLKRNSTNWNSGLTINLINTYKKYNELSESDFKYILAYLAFPQKFWKISRDYYKNIDKCNKNSFITLFSKGLNNSESQLDYINNMLYIYNLSSYIAKCKSKERFYEYRYKNSKYRSIWK